VRELLQQITEAKLGMRILAVTNMYPTPHASASGIFIEQQIKGLRQIGLDVEVMFVDRFQRGMRVYLGLRKQLHEMIGHFEPDVIHVMYGGIMAYQVVRSVDEKPIIVTFHGSDLLGERLSGVLRKLISGIGVRASWRAAHRANRIVVVAKALQDALPKEIDQSKVRIIPCGIDIGRFKPLNRNTCRNLLGWSDNRFHILFPANLDDPVKRPDLARAAVKALNRMGIKAEMHYLRGITNHEVPIWLNASNALLLTSLHEGSPTVIKEALACNLSIVSVDVGDVRERIQEIEGCYLALPNPDDLASKLQMIYTVPDRIKGRLKVQDLSLDCIAIQLKELYEEVLMPKGVSRG
jgi:teichuronic acid biosynthesis glycosyltransferase TuaC